MSKEHPILFSREMVKAILDGRKTQTRRVIKTQPVPDPDGTKYSKSGYWRRSTYHQSMITIENMICACPYGKVGDRLWVREGWQAGIEWDAEKPSEIDPLCGGNDIHYLADGFRLNDEDGWGKLRSPLFMPKWAARLWLEITGIRVERVQEISEEDAIAEGVGHREGPILRMDNTDGPTIRHYRDYMEINFHSYRFDTAINSFWTLWNFLNIKCGYGWEQNPWLWVIEFKPPSV